MGKLTAPIYLVIGLGTLWVAYLSATERLKRNGSVGMRTKATMASDATWYAAHRASAWSIAVAGSIFLPLCVWLLAAQPGDRAARSALIGSALAVLVVILIGGFRLIGLRRASWARAPKCRSTSCVPVTQD